MKIPGAVLLVVVAVTSAAAADRRAAKFAEGLKKLDLETRLEQICDYEAMQRIGRDAKGFRPDRSQSNAIADTKVDGDMLTAKGAAFRSKGQWYQLSFTCKGAPDHLSVVSFAYQIGDPIPESKWEEYGLWK
jgi:hypothetical protein